jgi:hypothetical protein
MIRQTEFCVTNGISGVETRPHRMHIVSGLVSDLGPYLVSLLPKAIANVKSPDLSVRIYE